MVTHVQITQNSKFAIPLQYITKEESDEVDFLHAEEDGGYLQINTMVLILLINTMIKHSQSFQNSKFAMSL